MKRRGNSVPFTMAGEAVAVEISAVIASPRPQKQKAPTTSVRKSAPQRPGNVTP